VTVLLWCVAVGVVLLLWRSFFPSYFSEKGKNLATKEDIAGITRQVEEVKSLYTERLSELEHQNALVLEHLRARQQLRLAAAERRLNAHQEAFTLWRSLLLNVHSDLVHSVVIECQDWWNRNCLYLSANARNSFNRAYFAASSHRELVRSRVSADEVSANMRLIRQAGDDIIAGAELPSLGPREAETAVEIPVTSPAA
jgi:hypothetical protein